MKKLIVIFIFLIKLVSGADVDFSCPEKVYFDEDFECKIEIQKNKISYDVKIVIKVNESGINKIWEGNSWQRADWYAKKLVNSKETSARVKIDKEVYGKAKGQIKLRESISEKIIYEDDFGIEIIKKEVPNKILENEEIELKEIKLNSKDIKTKNNTALLDTNTLKYAGLIFLGLFSGILYWIKEKRKNDRNKYKEDTFDINY